MAEIPDHDPAVGVRLRHEHPEVRPTHRQFARLVHDRDVDELRTIDAELDALMARRRAVRQRLASLRPRLWPASLGRHRRCPPEYREPPCPPPPVDAELVSGAELRHVIVAVLHRQGPLSLRELHGLLHRLGYAIDSARPVQRLGDAAAYEVRAGRLDRVERGVYEACVDRSVGEPALDERAPLPWAEPAPEVAGDEPIIDASVAWDPERWSGGAWPASSQYGSSAPDVPTLSPEERSLAADLHATNHAARHRIAELIATRLGPPPPRYDPGSSTRPIGDDSSTNRRRMRGIEDYEALVFDDDELDGDPEPPDDPDGSGGGPPAT